MSYTLNDVTGLTVVYKRIKLIKGAYRTFRKFYPNLKLIIIDNSEGDNCTEWLRTLIEKDKLITLIENKENIGHGAGLHMGVELANTDLVYMFDTDTTVMQSGGIEGMLELIDDDTYGVGEIIYTDLHGRNIPEDWKEGKLRFLLLSMGLVNKNQYVKFPKFTKFGLINFRAVEAVNQRGIADKAFKHFPISHYVRHLRGGTRARYGDCEDIVKGFKGGKGDMHSDLD